MITHQSTDSNGKYIKPYNHPTGIHLTSKPKRAKCEPGLIFLKLIKYSRSSNLDWHDWQLDEKKSNQYASTKAVFCIRI